MSEVAGIIECLRELNTLYEKLLELEEGEKKALIDADTSELSKAIELKKYIALRIGDVQSDLGGKLSAYNVGDLSALKSLLGDREGIRELDELHTRLKKLAGEIRRIETLNFYIAQEHVRFYNALISLYSGVISRDVGYNREARLELGDNRLSLRV